MKTNTMAKVYDVNENEVKMPDGWRSSSYVSSPVCFIGDEIENVTDFVNNIYKVCEIQGSFSLISERNIPEPWNPNIVIKEKVSLIPISKERVSLIPHWDEHSHLFRIVRQELAVSHCRRDREFAVAHCILSDYDYKRQKRVKGHFLVVDVNKSTIKVMTDLDIKDTVLAL